MNGVALRGHFFLRNFGILAGRSRDRHIAFARAKRSIFCPFLCPSLSEKFNKFSILVFLDTDATRLNCLNGSGMMSYRPKLRPKKVVLTIQTMDFNDVGFFRLRDVLSIVPVSKSTWWEGIKSGRFPKGIKLTPKCTAWLKRDIFALAKRLESDSSSSCDGLHASPESAVIH